MKLKIFVLMGAACGLFALAAGSRSNEARAPRPDGEVDEGIGREVDVAPAPKSVPSRPMVAAVGLGTDPVAELARLESCYTVSDCEFGSSASPTAYQDELDRAILVQLRRLRERVSSAEVERLARRFVIYPNDDVKEAALIVLALVPPSSATRDAILAGLRDSVSAPLYERGLEILVGLQTQPGRESLDEFLFDTILRGGHFVSIEVARRSLRFLTEENVMRFRVLRDRLAPRSRARAFLDLNLREFHRLQRGE